jgi:hypothetical protein
VATSYGHDTERLLEWEIFGFDLQGPLEVGDRFILDMKASVGEGRVACGQE